jgi:hypothetical protein
MTTSLPGQDDLPATWPLVAVRWLTGAGYLLGALWLSAWAFTRRDIVALEVAAVVFGVLAWVGIVMMTSFHPENNRKLGGRYLWALQIVAVAAGGLLALRSPSPWALAAGLGGMMVVVIHIIVEDRARRLAGGR